jgi:DNA-binding NtrC family response regulator
MKIQLIESDTDLREALGKYLHHAGASVISLDKLGEYGDRATDSKPDEIDLVVVGQHAPSHEIAALSGAVWPTPLAALLPVFDTPHIVQAIKAGAVDVFDRASSPQEIAEWVLGLCDAERTNFANSSKTRLFQSEACVAMHTVQQVIERIALTDSTALIVGETGTGKELAARQIHLSGSRAHQPIVTVNCAAIPDTLIESELFGYDKGAFTGATSNRIGLIEAADGGTLFLDEIGELPLAAQARLLRFIQEGEIRRIGSVTSKKVDVRLICATHRDLAKLAARNEFRRDLFYRIDVLRLTIPPLRERQEDIIAMANWFIQGQAQTLGIPERPLSSASEQALLLHSWPGNVRELQNVIERALVMSSGNCLDITLSTNPEPAEQFDGADAASPSSQGVEGVIEELSLEDYFQRFVLEHQDAMNETELAHKLGISRKCLWERRQRFGIPRKKQKTA